MISKSDIVEIGGREDWFKAGFEYGLISWTSTFNRMGKPNPYDRIQKIIVGIIAEKAVEEYLSSQGIEYETKGKTKWYEVDRYDIGISEYAMDVKSNFLDCNTKYIQTHAYDIFTEFKEWLTKCTALVPLDQLNPGKNKARAHKKEKLYIFPFVLGATGRSYHKDNLVHAFWDYRWLKKGDFQKLSNLGFLRITYSGELNNSKIELYGTTQKNVGCREIIDLNTQNSVSKNNYFQIFSIYWMGDPPNGDLTIESQYHNLQDVISPEITFSLEKRGKGYWPVQNNWQSVSIKGVKFFLAGWITENNFRVEGVLFPRFAKNIAQYSEIKVDNWGCEVSELEPMGKIKEI